MRIHYLSCHEVLEFDEVRLLTELGHEVFSNGAYLNPKGHPGLHRPAIENAPYFPEWEQLAKSHPRTELPDKLIYPFDAFIVMHTPELIIHNWKKLRGKTVIWRSIGQSTPFVENVLRQARNDGMKIVRYSPNERLIPNFNGEDAMIRFYKDPKEFGEWSGHNKQVINFTQSLKGRRTHCHYEKIIEALSGFPAKVFGPGNEDLGDLNGGDLPFDLMKGQLRDSRAFLYAGTYPACYTLTFIEAWMTGIPMVCLGKQTVQNIPGAPHFDFYEVENLIKNGKNGFVADSIDELKLYIKQLLENDKLAKSISEEGRREAIKVFGKAGIKKQWREFLDKVKP